MLELFVIVFLWHCLFIEGEQSKYLIEFRVDSKHIGEMFNN